MSDLYSNYIRESNGDIAHYGVLGMKWGVRKAEQYTNAIDASRYRAGLKTVKSMTPDQISAEKKKRLKKQLKLDYKKAKRLNKANAKSTAEALREQIRAGQHKDEKKEALKEKAIASLEKEVPGFSKYAANLDAITAKETKQIIQNSLMIPLVALGGFGVFDVTNTTRMHNANNEALDRATASTEAFQNYMRDLLKD